MDADENALGGDARAGGDVTPYPNSVLGKVPTESDGDVGSREGVKEPRRGGVFKLHKGDAETGVINPERHFVVLRNGWKIRRVKV